MKKPVKKPVKNAAKNAKKRGRPSKFTEAIADEICARLAKGEPLAAICRARKMPDPATVWRWTESDETFSQAIARARQLGFDEIAAECLRIADTQKTGVRKKMGPKGMEETTEDMLGHRKLQIETRLKLLSKWDPKRYGDRVDVAHSGSMDVEITIGGDDAE